MDAWRITEIEGQGYLELTDDARFSLAPEPPDCRAAIE